MIGEVCVILLYLLPYFSTLTHDAVFKEHEARLP